MTTFALVHGGSHGPWCWEEIVPLLHDAGHTTVTPDLPIEDTDAGALEWAKVVVDAVGDREDVVVVGHSLAGLVVPVVASLRPVSRMVFLCAMVPVPGMVYAEYLQSLDQLAVTLTPDKMTTDSAGRAVVPYETAMEFFYHDCDPGQARAAANRLRPQANKVFAERCPIEEWPDVPSSYILCTEDRAVSPAWSRQVCRDRLGITPIELPGGHSPFLSRPAACVDALLAAAG